MPPPSPPHPYGSRSQSVNAPPSLLARDAPSNQPHRPGSSMSISAMLGSDPERPARDAGSSLFSRPSTSSILAPRQHQALRLCRRPRPQRARSSLLGAEQSKFGGLTRVPPSQYPEKPHSTHPSPQVSPADLPYEPRRMSFSGPIARPDSQPPNAEAPTRPPRYSPLSRPGGLTDRFDSGPRASSASYGGTEAHAREPHNRYSGLFGDRRSEEAARDRERDRASHTSDSKASLGGPTRFGSIYGERDMLERHSSASTWDQGRSHPSSPEAKRFPPPESSSGFGFGAIQSYTKSLGSQPGGSRQPPSIQTGHGQPPLSPRGSPYLGKTQTQPQRVSSTPTSAASTGSALLGLASAGEEGRRKGSDELLQHRNLLNVGFNGKRGGRASPLPQAVQVRRLLSSTHLASLGSRMN
ncbi:Histone deacetylation protein Rxt3 [Penicillium chermesinum]|nr:Histone deacetylation protein Rxt3 [Penicillium chermesinum]